jgi:hypothetical protein
MTNQSRNFDALPWPQKVHIAWRMETPEDETTDAPDERQYGFWPSRDKNDAGYVPAAKFNEAQKEAQRLMDGWKRGDWSYIGVVAVAEVYVPIGQGSFVTHTFRSAGLWGVESYSPEYHKEVFEDQKIDLLDQLKTLGAALQSGEFIQR